MLTPSPFSLRAGRAGGPGRHGLPVCRGAVRAGDPPGRPGGVRHSLENPFAYSESNLTGMLTVLEGCRQHGIRHLIYASSSSVYGMGEQLPFSADQQVDHPVSLYAATKKSGELMAHAYSALYSLPTTGLRFSPSTAPGAGPTWPSPSSPAPSWRASPSTSTTRATSAATSPSSTTSSRDPRRRRAAAPPQPSVARRRAEPGRERRALSHPQHRPWSAGAAARLHRGAGTGAGQARHQADAADAGGRHARHLGRQRAPPHPHRPAPRHLHQGRGRRVRALVSRLLPARPLTHSDTACLPSGHQHHDRHGQQHAEHAPAHLPPDHLLPLSMPINSTSTGIR